MKKVSLLAASVAFALVGCGSDSSSDSGATPAPGGVVITGFDGYFNNAVVFDDKDNNGVLSTNENIFGLTDSNGQVNLTKAEFDSINTLALQTLTPGGVKQSELITRDPQTFAGVYTVDMDHPTQAMAHEVVFRAIPGEGIISPLTDLVAIEAGANPTDTDINNAKDTVNASLGLEADSEAAFSDVIADGDAKLHKTAQILTESKAAAEESDAAYIPTDAAKQATDVVDSASPEEIADKNFKPIVDTNVPVGETPAAPIINNKLVANESVKQLILDQLTPLESHQGINLELPLADEEDTALFADTDNTGDITVTATVTDKAGTPVGLTATAINGDKLIITGDATLVRDTYVITLTATDVDSTETAIGSTSTTFNLILEVRNEAPQVIADEQAKIQTWFNERELAQGVQPSLEYIIISDLFSDTDIDTETQTLEYNAVTSVVGLEVFIDDQVSTNADATLQLLKEPTYAYPAGETVTISAYDGVNTVYVDFTLPEIQEQNIKVDPEEAQGLQKAITETLRSLKVGEEIQGYDFDISNLFEDGYISGTLEYYVGLEENNDGDGEYLTTIPGVNVDIDENNTLTISGTPTEAVTNGRFIIMAGVNVDNEGEVISEPVNFSLPTVAPADEVIEPEPTLGFTDAHFNTGKVWKMGSFASNDGEIGHAMLWGDAQGLLFCWGSQDGAVPQYASNISRWDQGAFETLAQLDKLPNYAVSSQQDCWDVKLKDGKLYDEENTEYEMLYQNKITEDDYQIIVKIDGDEMFWMDSTDTKFAQSLSVHNKVEAGNVEFDMVVESDTPAQDDTKLYYAAGKFEYADDATYEYTSIMPKGFYTPGNLNIDTVDGLERLTLKETGTDSDYKTRYRYVNHNFGDFYVGIKWSEDNGGTSTPEFGLYSYSQEAMEKVVNQLPLLQD